jgi:sulfate adenylyltransferase
MMTLITPFGGRLVDLRVPAAELAERCAAAGRLPSVQLPDRAVCDLEARAPAHAGGGSNA